MVSTEDYVSDLDSGIPEFSFEIDRLDDAADQVSIYVETRLKEISTVSERPLAMMLSGGIDSILSVAISASSGIRMKAFTWHWAGSEQSTAELSVARAVCEHFGVEHQTISPDLHQIQGLILEVIEKLETTEPWEIGAGLVLHAIAEEVDRSMLGAPIVSSAGADTLLLGGKDLQYLEKEKQSLYKWQEMVSESIRSKFTKGRFIPDFYQRILSPGQAHFKVWQTKAAVQLASRLHPSVIKGPSWDKDKIVLREAAVNAGVPRGLVDNPKSPMQASSGFFRALEDLARSELAEEFKDRTYSDPLVEDLSLIVGRLYLDRLINGPQRF